jgi:hypothetical protein
MDWLVHSPFRGIRTLCCAELLVVVMSTNPSMYVFHALQSDPLEKGVASVSSQVLCGSTGMYVPLKDRRLQVIQRLTLMKVYWIRCRVFMCDPHEDVILYN